MVKKITLSKLPRSRKQFLPWLIAILIITFLSLVTNDQSKSVLIQNQPGSYRVSEFYDGDTIAVDMNGTKEKVRMIGVDTPETHDPRKNVQCYGKSASEYTKKLIGKNPVRLEADPTNQNRDRYNRLLRYVYIPDGRLVNAEIIKNGYGFAYTSFPFEKLDEFRNYQREAQENNNGLWNTCNPSKNEYGGFTSNDE